MMLTDCFYIAIQAICEPEMVVRGHFVADLLLHVTQGSTPKFIPRLNVIFDICYDGEPSSRNKCQSIHKQSTIPIINSLCGAPFYDLVIVTRCKKNYLHVYEAGCAKLFYT